jgi:T5SS/PEP-CTERM-associated repeat protein
MIQNGGNVSTGGFGVRNGLATVSGPGSTLTTTGGLAVGFGLAEGRFTIEAGGNASNHDGSVGLEFGTSGVVTVRGVGSTWTNSGILTIGDRGMGALTIEAGAHVSSLQAILGRDDEFSTGTVTVTGAGSTWTSGLLDVGFAGSGVLNITGGGSISNGFANVGTHSGARGDVVVDGLGSTWTVMAELTIGAGALGGPEDTLIVSDGGAVSAGGLIVNPGGTVAGNGTLSAFVVNHGVVSPGLNPGALAGVSPGPLDVDGNYRQEAEGRLTIRLGGASPGSGFDQLQVTGAVTLNGTLSVAFANAFIPSAGNVFDILDWGSLTGAFSTIQLPLLAAGLNWDTSHLYTSGVLTIVSSQLPGDFDHDFDVDADDLVQWRGDFGLSGDSDADNDGDSDGADFLVWQRQLGRTLSATASTSTVPEPGHLGIVGLAVFTIAAPRVLGRRL